MYRKTAMQKDVPPFQGRNHVSKSQRFHSILHVSAIFASDCFSCEANNQRSTINLIKYVLILSRDTSFCASYGIFTCYCFSNCNIFSFVISNFIATCMKFRPRDRTWFDAYYYVNKRSEKNKLAAWEFISSGAMNDLAGKLAMNTWHMLSEKRGFQIFLPQLARICGTTRHKFAFFCYQNIQRGFVGAVEDNVARS